MSKLDEIEERSALCDSATLPGAQLRSLVAVARAAMARPWIDTCGVCRGCHWFRTPSHGDGCRFAALDAALSDLSGASASANPAWREGGK